MTITKIIRQLVLATMCLAISSIGLAAASTIKQCVITVTGKTYSCEVGKTGVVEDKKEGDGATPAGDFTIRQIFYRPDRLSSQQMQELTALRAKGFVVNALTSDDGWSDDVNSPYYNQHVKISDYIKGGKNLSYETLWRDDDVYNVIAVVGYNDQPIVKGKGSAIFMHVMRKDPNGQPMPTVGCVSLQLDDLLNVLTNITPKSIVSIPVNDNRISIDK